MALNDAALNVAANAMAGVVTHLAIHTAQPDANGSNQSLSQREVVTWNAAAGGDIAAAAAVGFTGGDLNGPATHVGFWSAETAGTFYGWVPLTGDQTFNSAGEFTVNTVTLNGSAT